MKVGIMGGTFDPIHLGHLLIAEEVRIDLALDEVLFIPTGQPWMKEGRALSDVQHRLEMVRLAVASNPYFRSCSVEIDRSGPTYTVDTLTHLHQEVSHQGEYHLILGMDSFSDFLRWKEPQRILELCTLVVVGRPGYSHPDSLDKGSLLSKGLDKVIFLNTPTFDVSGTDIRRHVALGRSIRYRVPEEVEGYISRHGLYHNPEVAS